MTVWVIDDGPLGTLAQEFDPDWSWPSATLHVLDAVVRGAQNDRTGRRGQLLKMGGEEPAFKQHAVNIGSPAATYLQEHLRAKSANATADLGEHESIAWMRHEGPVESVFVTLDKGAAYLTLTELGRCRVARSLDLWDDLRQQLLITSTQFDSLCGRVERGDNLAFPTRLQRST